MKREKRKTKLTKKYARALVSLMDDLFFGPKAKRSYQQGFALAELLGGHGVAVGYRYLAHAYDFGVGVARDKRKAFINWRKAAFLGDTDSRAALAHAYAEGLGVQKALKKAIYWDGLAARGGN